MSRKSAKEENLLASDIEMTWEKAADKRIVLKTSNCLRALARVFEV